MDIYLINLDRRPDRLEFMHGQLDAYGLAYTRITAVDGLGDDDIGYPLDHPKMTKPEYACYLSHLKVYEELLKSGADHCLILEDDVHLSVNLPKVINDAGFFTNPDAIVRLEAQPHRFINAEVRVAKNVVGRFEKYQLLKVLSGCYATGAYVISIELSARILAEYSEPKRPIDLFLFQKHHITPPAPVILQVAPAVAVQQNAIGDTKSNKDGLSDIERSRQDRKVMLRHQDTRNAVSKEMSRRRNNIKVNSARIGRRISKMIHTYRVIPYDAGRQD